MNVKGIPSNQKIWVQYYDADNNIRYITTSPPQRDTYYIYKICNGAATKLGQNKDPTELARKFVRL